MSFQSSKNKYSAGFTFIEVIIAILVITVGIVGVLTMIRSSINAINDASFRLSAAYLAKEGMEIVRNVRDTNWLERTAWDEELQGCESGCEVDYNASGLSSFSDTPLNLETVSGLYGYDAGIPTTFKRKITITPVDADTYNVRVDVSWEDRGEIHSFDTVEENLYNWRP